MLYKYKNNTIWNAVICQFSSVFWYVLWYFYNLLQLVNVHQNVVKGLQEQFPAYAANFPVWADQANAMVQYAVWTTLAAVGVGANLQHYNPLPDAAIAKVWNIPENWLLRAQMVIGGIEGAAGEKAFEPVAERLKVFGA